MDFKTWFNESWQPATLDDYNVLFIMADYVEENPTQLKVWFQQFRNAIMSFSQKAGKIQDLLRNVWVDEPEEDPLEDLENWLDLHMLQAVDRVLNGNIVHNGPLFSVVNAIKNSYEHLSPYLKYEDYYYTPDDHSVNGVNVVNKQTHKLISDYIRFVKAVFPTFLRMAQVRWKPATGKNSFERLSSVPKFD